MLKKKKYNDKHFHFIIFQASEKPFNFSIPKWLIAPCIIMLILGFIICPMLLIHNYKRISELESKDIISQKTINDLASTKEKTEIENSSLKSSLKEKTAEIEKNSEDLEELQESIKKIKTLFNISDDSISNTPLDNGGSRNGGFNPREISLTKNYDYSLLSDLIGLNSSEHSTSLEYTISKSLDELSKIETIISDKIQYLKDVPSIIPAVGRYSSFFGPRWGTNHRGVDIAGVYGSDIISAGNGTVVETGYNGSFGYYILIQHKYGFTTRYAHLRNILVKPWQEVVQGEVIGLMGNTGYSFGTHLHYEITYYGNLINPLTVEKYFEE